MKASFWGSCLATILAVGSLPTQAEDIDLFIQPSSSSNLPNVLILVDNTANWSRTVAGQAIFINEKKALVDTFNNLPQDKFRVGLMLFTETGTGNSGDDGGYVRMAIRTMTADNKTKYAAMINSLNENADKSNGGKAGKTFSEAYQYFSGLAPYTGNQKVKTDYTGNVSGTLASQAIYALPGNALNSKNGTPYNSPIPGDTCAPNYLIYLSNGAAQDNSADNSTASTRLATAATADGVANATTPIPLTPSDSATNVADEWARFMGKSSKNIITYTIDVDRIDNRQGRGWTRLLKSIAGDNETSAAQFGDTENPRYFSVTSGNGGASITAAFGDIFSKIQAKNSVFASVSLPVTVNPEGTYLNQVYIGMFRPDADALPRWYGNLKQYKLVKLGNQLRTVDAYEYPDTINADTGFIDRCARSFWTPTSTAAYWAFAYPSINYLDTNEIDVCTGIPATPLGSAVTYGRLESAQSNVPDGNFVEKGAAAYVRRGSTTRTLKTCSGMCTSGLSDFNTTNVGYAALGVTSTEHANTIDWAKGLDVDDEDNDTTTSEMRPSTHGDVVHSRPVAVNFGLDPTYPFNVSADGPRVVVFYGGNDGVLRAINGNRQTAFASTAAGQELWGFIPEEFYTRFKDLRSNTVEIDYEGTTASVTQSKPYGVDGPITSYRSGSTVWLYAAMRRGGRSVYAFDVTGIADDSPTEPSLKWKIGCDSSGSCSSDMGDIGQTWSAPKVIKAEGYGGGAVPLIVMGGGYDTCQDNDPANCGGSSKGRKIYVIDGDDGSVQASFDTESQVVGEVVFSVDQSTGYARWGYAADMAGNIYRISGDGENAPIGTTAPDQWTLTKIADLGCATPSACSAPRKFMFAPGLINEGGDSYVLTIGSGDREKPLRSWSSAYNKTNYFFVLRDYPLNADWLADEDTATRCNDPVLCLNSLAYVSNGGNNLTETDLAGKKGWYLGLNEHEQVVTTTITVFGTTTFSTHTPVPAGGNQCLNTLGTARVYNVSYKNAAAKNGTNNRSEEISGGGLPPSPVAGMVRLDNGQLVPFLIGGDPDSPLQSLVPSGPSITNQPKAITYWYIQK